MNAVDPLAFDLDVSVRTLDSRSIPFTFEPAEYKPQIGSVTIYEEGTPVYTTAAKVDAGSGVATVSPSVPFDLEKSYSFSTILNKGNPYSEVKSDPIAVSLSQPILLSVAGTVDKPASAGPTPVAASTLVADFASGFVDVDVLNGFVCQSSPELHIATSQAARLTIQVTRGTLSTTIIDDVLYSAGQHEIEIPISSVGEGLYNYTVTAVSEIDGHEETAVGALLIRNNYTAALPIGHANVQNVDLFDGHLALSRTDISLPGRGPAIELKRSYYSSAGSISRFGVGWTHNYDSFVFDSGCGAVTVAGGDGGGVRFFPNGANPDGSTRYRASQGFHGTLKIVSGGYDFYSKDGTRYHYKKYGFSGDGRWHLKFIEDTNGNVTSLAYDPSQTRFAKLDSILDSSERSLNFNYEFRSTVGGYGPVIKGVTSEGLSVAYSYDEVGHLIGVVHTGISHDGEVETGKSESYGYKLSRFDQLTTEVPEDRVEFEERAALSSVTDARGNVTSYTSDLREIYVSDDVRGSTVTLPFYLSVNPPATGQTSFTYSPREVRTPTGTLSAIVQAPRSSSTYTLNNYGSPITIQGPAGTKSMTWKPDDVLLESSTDENGVTTRFEYDQHGNVTSEKVGNNPAISTTYWLLGSGEAVGTIKNRVRERKDRKGRKTAFTYDARGNIESKVLPDGTIEGFAYASNGDLMSITDRRAYTTRYGYDGYGYRNFEMDALGGKIESTWSTRGVKLTENDKNGNTTTFTYDGLDRLLTIRNAREHTKEYLYDLAGNKKQEKDERGNITLWDYDADNRVTTITDPYGLEKILTYDAAGNLQSETDFRGNVTTYSYDLANRQTGIAQPLGRTLTRNFDGVGNIIDETDALGNITKFKYDEFNRQTEIEDADGGITAFVYDDAGNLVEKIDALAQKTTYEYDALDRQTVVTKPLGRISTTVYDENGNVVEQIDPNGGLTKNRYDDINRLIKTTDPEGHIQRFEYDAVGNIEITTDGRNNTTVTE